MHGKPQKDRLYDQPASRAWGCDLTMESTPAPVRVTRRAPTSQRLDR
jgi:hypothetical protein